MQLTGRYNPKTNQFPGLAGERVFLVLTETIRQRSTHLYNRQSIRLNSYPSPYPQVRYPSRQSTPCRRPYSSVGRGVRTRFGSHGKFRQVDYIAESRLR